MSDPIDLCGDRRRTASDALEPGSEEPEGKRTNAAVSPLEWEGTPAQLRERADRFLGCQDVTYTPLKRITVFVTKEDIVPSRQSLATVLAHLQETRFIVPSMTAVRVVRDETVQSSLRAILDVYHEYEMDEKGALLKFFQTRRGMSVGPGFMFGGEFIFSRCTSKLSRVEKRPVTRLSGEDLERAFSDARHRTPNILSQDGAIRLAAHIFVCAMRANGVHEVTANAERVYHDIIWYLRMFAEYPNKTFAGQCLRGMFQFLGKFLDPGDTALRIMFDCFLPYATCPLTSEAARGVCAFRDLWNALRRPDIHEPLKRHIETLQFRDARSINLRAARLLAAFGLDDQEDPPLQDVAEHVERLWLHLTRESTAPELRCARRVFDLQLAESGPEIDPDDFTFKHTHPCAVIREIRDAVDRFRDMPPGYHTKSNVRAMTRLCSAAWKDVCRSFYDLGPSWKDICSRHFADTFLCKYGNHFVSDPLSMIRPSRIFETPDEE